MISSSQLLAALTALRITHVVWLPDSVLGAWEQTLQAEPSIKLVRVCREGEAWAIAAGLWLAGARPLVMIQNTGLFESGDGLRNALFDLDLPLVALIGYRSYLSVGGKDSACRFTEPILDAWSLDYTIIDAPQAWPRFTSHLEGCLKAGKPGVVLLAEGSM